MRGTTQTQKVGSRFNMIWFEVASRSFAPFVREDIIVFRTTEALTVITGFTNKNLTVYICNINDRPIVALDGTTFLGRLAQLVNTRNEIPQANFFERISSKQIIRNLAPFWHYISILINTDTHVICELDPNIRVNCIQVSFKAGPIQIAKLVTGEMIFKIEQIRTDLLSRQFLMGNHRVRAFLEHAFCPKGELVIGWVKITQFVYRRVQGSICDVRL